MDSLCREITAFSRATKLPESKIRISGGNTPSETNSFSQFPDSASKQTAVAAFSLTLREVADIRCTRADTLLRPKTAITLFSSSLIALNSPSSARCFASACPIWRRASSSRRFQLANSVSAGRAPVAEGGGSAASPRTPILTRRPQSRRLRSSFPERASRSLCIWSFPTEAPSSLRHRPANSTASERVAATDWTSSRQRACRAKQGWLERSSFPERASRSLCIWSFPTEAPSSLRHRPANSTASERVAATDWTSSRQRACRAKQGWLERSERLGGTRSSLEAMDFHRPGKPLADLALSRATGTRRRARESQCSADPAASQSSTAAAMGSVSSTMARCCS
ncbi:hypothetical protein C4D60_Mb01t19110 [Musa balbisiana]|uniref:Uncharacterized protein n=1 Tax=Musa balbisiana TaxID=52838 RepID=A0A4S8JNM9_MUSBA|nr:hypothetical protein C4D60_Mb01t19110 [Musa balbisiana]